MKVIENKLSNDAIEVIKNGKEIYEGDIVKYEPTIKVSFKRQQTLF